LILFSKYEDMLDVWPLIESQLDTDESIFSLADWRKSWNQVEACCQQSFAVPGYLTVSFLADR
jgi:hypothetical protein